MLAEEANTLEFIEGIMKILAFIQHKLHAVIHCAFLLLFESAFCLFFTYDRRIKPVDTIIPSDL